MQKTFFALLMLCFCQSSFAAKKIEAAKEDLGELQQKIEALKKELESHQAEHQDAADALKESETAISQANKKLRDITQQQRQNQNKLDLLKKQSLGINAQLGDQQKQLGQLIYQQYTLGNPSYTQLILQNKNPSTIMRDLKYQSYITEAHAKLIDGMQNNLNKVKELHQETTTALQEVADLKAKQVAENRELQAQKNEKAKVLKSLSKQIAAQRGEIKKLSRDEKRLSDLVERLAKIATRPPKKKQPKRHAPSNNNIDNEEKPAQVIAKNEDTPDSSDIAGNFAALRGKLKLPIRGELINRFGSQRQDSGMTWKGLFIRAAEGTEVKSIAIGRVVFADWLRGFGNLIILDHGDGYMSLYGNNQAVFKRVGDEVNPGDTIASVGNSGGNESSGLYYELRRASKPFDPLSWSILK